MPQPRATCCWHRASDGRAGRGTHTPPRDRRPDPHSARDHQPLCRLLTWNVAAQGPRLSPPTRSLHWGSPSKVGDNVAWHRGGCPVPSGSPEHVVDGQSRPFPGRLPLELGFDKVPSRKWLLVLRAVAMSGLCP